MTNHFGLELCLTFTTSSLISWSSSRINISSSESSAGTWVLISSFSIPVTIAVVDGGVSSTIAVAVGGVSFFGEFFFRSPVCTMDLCQPTVTLKWTYFNNVRHDEHPGSRVVEFANDYSAIRLELKQGRISFILLNGSRILSDIKDQLMIRKTLIIFIHIYSI